MNNPLEPPCIPADADIAGIGVRAAIYIQNLLGFIPAISALWDGEIAPYELEAVETQSTTILITSFALLISAFIEARSFGKLRLSVFHANVILSLSWMNNTNTFIYFLLYVQQRSQLGPRQIRSDLLSGWKGVKAWFASPDGDDDRKAQKSKEDQHTKSLSATPSIKDEQRSLLQAIFRVRISGIIAITILGSLHLSIMSAMGLWLWRNPRTFGIGDDNGLCALTFSFYVILGKHIPLRSKALRIVSLAIYGTFLVPGLNVIIPMAFFLGMLFIYRACHGRRQAGIFHSPSSRNMPSTSTERLQFRAKGPVGRSLVVLQTWYNPFLFPTIAGMILLFAINIALICNTELTLRHNKWLETDGSENEWSFGQVLAILLLLIPLRELRVFGARRDFTSSLQNAVRWHASTDVLRDLVRRGAHVDVRAEGSTYPTALHLAVSDRRDAELARMLLVYGANPDIKDGTDRTPLQAASLHGDLQIARLLLAHGADPNIEGGEYSTALQAASHAGHLQIAQLLLESGADVNTHGQKYRSALEAASTHGHTEIVALLQEHGAAPD